MSYRIEQRSDKFEVMEVGYKDTLLERCDTEDLARKAIREWEARDELSDKISDFYGYAIDNYGTLLEEKEIIEMIKEYS